jgi:polyhydroxyalkanoate synthesis repressor PhaR
VTTATERSPTIIKKYANRRLYHTGTSSYVTLDDLAQMVKAGEEFVVTDAKTGDDITRPVLAQIIFEQEGKEGQNLLPITFLRQLIRFYGDSMQTLVPSYLDFSIENLVREQQKMRDQFSKSFGPAAALKAMEERARTNMAMFGEALRLFTPFTPPGGGDARPGASPTAAPERSQEIAELKKQLDDAQRKLDKLTQG